MNRREVNWTSMMTLGVDFVLLLSEDMLGRRLRYHMVLVSETEEA